MDDHGRGGVGSGGRVRGGVRRGEALSWFVTLGTLMPVVECGSTQTNQLELEYILPEHQNISPQFPNYVNDSGA